MKLLFMLWTLISLLCHIPSANSDLLQVIQDAYQHDPELKAGFFSIQQQQADLEYYQGRLGPEVWLTGDYQYKKTQEFTPNDELEGSIGKLALILKKPVLDLSQSRRVGLSQLLVKQERLRHQQREEHLISLVAHHYLAILKQQTLLTLSEKEEEALHYSLNLVTKRHAIGLATSNEVLEAQAELDRSLAQRFAIEQQRSTERWQVARLTGRELGLDVLPGLSKAVMSWIDSVEIAVKTPQACMDQAKVSNLALNLAIFSVRLNQQSQSIEQAKLYPTLDLMGEVSHEKSSVSGQPDVNEHIFGVSVNVPLYFGGSSRAAIRSAQFKANASEQQLESVRRQIQAECVTILGQLNSLQAQIKATVKLDESLSKTLLATKERYKVGQRNLLDVLNATRERYHVKSQLASLRYDRILSLFDLKRLVGDLQMEHLPNT